MVTLADVRRWDAAELETALRSLGTTRDRLLDLDGSLARSRPGEDVWQGAAADRARAGHDALAERLRRIVSGTTASRLALADAADAVATFPAQLRQADDLAAARGFTIAPDGTVVDAHPPTVAPEQVATVMRQRTAAQAEIADILGRVLNRAAHVDTALRDALNAAVAGQIDDGTGTGLTDAAVFATHTAAATPPAGATPAQVADWWKRLGTAGQERLLVEHPEAIGNLDGIPAGIRDEANRARLPELTARIDAELSEAEKRWKDSLHPIPSNPPGVESPEQRSLRENLVRLQEQRKALTAVTQASTGDNRQLVLMDIDGKATPHAAVAVGNLDTARHVAVFTPGLTTTVAGSLGGYTADMEALRRATKLQLGKVHRSDEDVATVAWLGYDAPQWSNTLDPSRSVGGEHAADVGGGDLAHFYDGIRADRPDAHLTALGHSYGSTTTGQALQHTANQVDDAVVFGSPGLTTDNVSDLHVPAGHVNSIKAPTDIVGELGRFDGNPDFTPGITRLSAHPADAPDGAHLDGSVWHGEYLAPGTTSQYNIAATVAGIPENHIVDSPINDFMRRELLG